MKDTYARGRMAMSAYLERVGMMLLDDSGKSHVIALDEDTVVWVDLRVSTESADYPRPAVTTIKKHAREAARFAAERGLDTSVRVDLITIKVLAEDRALLRHERNLEA